MKTVVNPRNAPRLAPGDVAKLTSKEKEDRQVTGRVTRLQQLEVEICRSLLQSQSEGWIFDPEQPDKKELVPIEDIIVQAFGADDEIMLDPKIREKMIERGGPGSSTFRLKKRAEAIAELEHFRLPADANIELPGANRAERRAAREHLDRYPFREIAKTLKQQPFPSCYYAVVHSFAGASVFPFKYDREDMEAALAEEAVRIEEERAKQAALEAAPVPPAE